MMNFIATILRPHLKKLSPYIPDTFTLTADTVLLNTNESPWDQNYHGVLLNRYPEKQPAALRSCLAELYGVQPQQLLLTRGSDEGIDLLTRLCCDPDDGVIICPPTFGMYGICAQLQAAQIYSIPLTNTFELDIAAFKQFSAPVKLIFLCSPNNPTGKVIKQEDIITICEKFKETLVVVDEAYIEFSHSPSCIEQLKSFKNLVILRTLSKAYGLANLRVGIVIADAEIIDWLSRIIHPFAIPGTIIQDVLTLLNETTIEKVQQQLRVIETEKEKLFKQLEQFHFVKTCYQSDANFILIEVADAMQLIKFCRSHQLIIRSMQQHERLENCVRVSIGTPEQNIQLIKIFDLFDKGNP